MKFELSNHIALQHPDWRTSSSFYSDVFGLKTDMKETHVHIQSGDLSLYIMENDDLRGTVLEFNVEDVEEAKENLLSNGCEVVKWEGKGKDCYMRDPYGLTFNLWETS